MPTTSLPITRTGTVTSGQGRWSAIEFLEANGIDSSRWPEQETYESPIKVAEHQMDRLELAEFFRSRLS